MQKKIKYQGSDIMKDNKIVSNLNTKFMVITFNMNEFMPQKKE